MNRVKYPRTPHLPWSLGRSPDDVAIDSLDDFRGGMVVVTEKMDGECTTLYRDGIHARSLSSAPHPSRDWVRALHGRIAHEIPDEIRICGENVFAQHSIAYDALPSYFLVFAVFEEDICLSWSSTEEWAGLLGLDLVPVLYRGMWDEAKIKACQTGISKFGGEQEGYVVRNANEFPVEKFSSCVAKFVRAHHVQTDDHWMHRSVIPNHLRGGRS